MRKRLFFVPLLAALLLIINDGGAQADIVLTREESGEKYVEYPVISGMDNIFAQTGANALILAAAQPHLDTLALLRSGAPGMLRVSAEYEILKSAFGHDVLSVLLEHDGRMPGGRSGHGFVPVTVDLATGQSVTADALFTDAALAQALLDELAGSALAETLSNYLNPDDFLPMHINNLLVGRDGLTFFYPTGAVSWLSGKAAALRFLWHELESALDLRDGSLLHGLGVRDMLVPGGETPSRIHEDVKNGTLPGVPAVLGDSMENLMEKYRLLFDPEGFPGATAYYMEDDRFRGAALLSEDEETLSGILTTRLNLSGLIIGKATREEATRVLGEPHMSIALNRTGAGAYGLPAGNMDTYLTVENELRLHYDVSGVLRAVWLAHGE